jgi:excisionase family DNA binding protein
MNFKETKDGGRLPDGKLDSVLFENWITKKELAQHLRVSESFLEKQMAQEGLPYLRIGRAVRFRLEEVSDWLRKRRYP